MTPSIQQITATQALPLRQAVLWPDHPAQFSAVEGDDDALHFGAYLGGDLIGVGSLFRDGSKYRLRKLAVLPDHQGRGVGRLILTRMIQDATQHGAQTIWCDARMSAFGFYDGLGFYKTGSPFTKKGLPYHVMEYDLTLP